MSKGQETSQYELMRAGWVQKDSLTPEGYEIWVNSFLASYLYFDPKKKRIIDVIDV